MTKLELLNLRESCMPSDGNLFRAAALRQQFLRQEFLLLMLQKSRAIRPSSAILGHRVVTLHPAIHHDHTRSPELSQQIINRGVGKLESGVSLTFEVGDDSTADANEFIRRNRKIVIPCAGSSPHEIIYTVVLQQVWINKDSQFGCMTKGGHATFGLGNSSFPSTFH